MRAIRLSVFLMGCAICGAVSAQTGQQKTQPSPDLDQMIATRIRVESPICQPLAGMVRDIADFSESQVREGPVHGEGDG